MARDLRQPSPENSLSFPQNFHIRETGDILRKLVDLVEFRGFDVITLDFSGVEICFPDAILPLISHTIKYRDEGVRFAVIPPTYDPLTRTFQSSNWLHHFDPRRFDATTDARFGRLSAQRFRDSKEQHVLLNQIIDCILRTTTFLRREHLRALEWSINEITDNVLQHAKSDSGGLIQLALKPNAKEIEFVVCDSGIGIPESLRSGLGQSWSDERALEEAVKEGISSGAGQGNGLFGSIRIAAESGGAFSINSGGAFLNMAHDKRTKIFSQRCWLGTSVDCNINYSTPLVLERALSFNNTPHTPVDLIELAYEQEATNLIKINLREEAESIGTRPAGFAVRRKTENLIKLTNADHVVFDCTGLAVMSSSFADELVAKLVQAYGVDGFAKMFSLRNIHETNLMIIDRSVRQRVGVSFFEIIRRKE